MEIVKDVAALKKRWTSGAGRDLARTAQQRILRNEALDGIGLQKVDGRADLRCMTFPASLRELSGVRIRRVDLSGAKLANLRIVDAAIEDCRFEGADCRYWHLRGSSVDGCSFARADLRDSTLGEWFQGRGNYYRGVSFEAARFLRATTSAAVYDDCDFSHAELDRVNFWQSSLIRCRFAGGVREVVFDGRMLGEGKPTSNPMEFVDLTDATIDGCEFRGVTFDTVVLPADPALIRIRDTGVVDRALVALAGIPADSGTAIAEVVLGHVRKVLAMGGEALVNLRDAEPAGTLVGRLIRDASMA
ncbi:pentapeptide repeat-containing protein [Actinoplanes sp. NPDC051851]|uniref:pentapeptide repeat-containing protein n=1 Tax=Actinoplanes sp. NPDC051851 TaxID=3154753 RepID=UPI00341C9392